MNKWIVLAVITLFIGVAVAPSITGEVNLLGEIQQESPDTGFQNEELVKITVKIIDVDEVQEHIVMLTQQQADELDILIDNYKIDLGTAETTEETKEVYLDMIESLYNIGIYPAEMSIEDVSQLIFDDRIQFNQGVNSESTFDMNKNCLISGETTYTIYKLGLIGIGLRLFDLLHGGTYWEPGEGWVDTSGVNGNIRWEGSLWGYYGYTLNGGIDGKFKLDYLIGVIGFIGTFIYKAQSTGKTFYQGFAVGVRIGYDANCYSINGNQNIQTRQQQISQTSNFNEDIGGITNE